jgi:serine/threonine-protein kinase
LAERARQAAEKAISLAPGRPEGYLALGMYKDYVLHDPNRALEEFEKGQRVAPTNAALVRATAGAERDLGRWDAALDHFRQAERLDPLSVKNLSDLGDALLWLRRYSEAREAFDRGLALAPANLWLIERKAMTWLGQGDLAGARAVLKAVPKEVDPTALVTYMASMWNLGWVLDDGELELLLRLTPGAFDNDRGMWAICLATASALKRDAASFHSYAQQAREAFEEQLLAVPDDALRHSFLGVALAYLGQKPEAIREGQRAVVLLSVARDSFFGPLMKQLLALIYIQVGEPEKALDVLEPLLKIPYFLSPGWLRIDPTFDPLRKNPRFQKLVAGAN